MRFYLFVHYTRSPSENSIRNYSICWPKFKTGILERSKLDYFAGVIRMFAEQKGRDFRHRHCEPEDFSPDHIHGERFDGRLAQACSVCQL